MGFLIYVCCLFCLLVIVSWLVHLSMNNNDIKPDETKYFITYWQFKKLMSMYKQEMHTNNMCKHSLFGIGIYIHASIVCIKDKYYYLITPFQWFLAQCLIWKYTKKAREHKYSFFKI